MMKFSRKQSRKIPNIYYMNVIALDFLFLKMSRKFNFFTLLYFTITLPSDLYLTYLLDFFFYFQLLPMCQYFLRYFFIIIIIKIILLFILFSSRIHSTFKTNKKYCHFHCQLPKWNSKWSAVHRFADFRQLVDIFGIFNEFMFLKSAYSIGSYRILSMHTTYLFCNNIYYFQW